MVACLFQSLYDALFHPRLLFHDGRGRLRPLLFAPFVLFVPEPSVLLFEQSIVGFYRIRAAASHETSHAVILKSEFAGDGFQRFGRRFVQPDRFGVFFRTAAQDRFPVVQSCLAEQSGQLRLMLVPNIPENVLGWSEFCDLAAAVGILPSLEPFDRRGYFSVKFSLR